MSAVSDLIKSRKWFASELKLWGRRVTCSNGLGFCVIIGPLERKSAPLCIFEFDTEDVDFKLVRQGQVEGLSTVGRKRFLFLGDWSPMMLVAEVCSSLWNRKMSIVDTRTFEVVNTFTAWHDGRAPNVHTMAVARSGTCIAMTCARLCGPDRQHFSESEARVCFFELSPDGQWTRNTSFEIDTGGGAWCHLQFLDNDTKLGIVFSVTPSVVQLWDLPSRSCLRNDVENGSLFWNSFEPVTLQAVNDCCVSAARTNMSRGSSRELLLAFQAKGAAKCVCQPFVALSTDAKMPSSRTFFPLPFGLGWACGSDEDTTLGYWVAFAHPMMLMGRLRVAWMSAVCRQASVH
jgi:hypothetical protein